VPVFTVPIHENNDCHTPAGSSEGGQFCSGHGEYLGSRDAAQQRVLRNYTRWTDPMRTVNSKLRKGRPLLPAQQKLADAMDALIQHAPPLAAPVTVWRGVSGVHYKGLKPGDTVTFHGFSSGSLDVEQAARRIYVQREEPVLFKITTQRGLHVAPASIIPSEQEFLLPHGATATVTRIGWEDVPVNALVNGRVVTHAPLKVIHVQVGR